VKVLYVTSVYPRWPGDATPPFVQNQAELMAAQGYQVRVLAPHAQGAVLREEGANVTVRRYRYMWPTSAQKLCYDGGMLIQLKAKRWTMLLLPFLLLAQTCRVFFECLRWKPDLIHSHSLLPQGLVCALAHIFFKIPHVATSHGNDVFGLKSNGVMGALKRFVLRRSDAITVNSSATKSRVLELDARAAEKTFLIPAVANTGAVNADEVVRIQKRFPAAKRVAFVGRLIEEKGVFDLVEALARVREENPDLIAIFIGDGVAREDLEALVREQGLKDVIHFVGWRPREEISNWLAAVDVLAVPSWREAQGLVIVEAMLAGTPVIGSRVGGIPNLVEDGVTGRLFTAKDIDSLSVCLIDFFRDRAGVTQMAIIARERANSSYSSSAVSSLIRKLYEAYDLK
jgi:glycosyltransferase involved in cell wall biosynthesis